jgi:hypothetical protein
MRIPRPAVLVAFLLVAACDPGYRLQPTAWKAEKSGRWSQDFEGFSLSTRTVEGLVGEWWLDLTFHVYANSRPVSLKVATLKSGTAVYDGSIDPELAAVPKGGGPLAASWRFGEGHGIREVIGDSATIELHLVVGSTSQTVAVLYKQVPCCGSE